MTAHAICDCRLCRLGIRRAVADELRARRRWLGPYMIRYLARLGWVPVETYLGVIDEMVGYGLLIRTRGPDDPFPRYMLSELTLPPDARKRGAR